MQQYPEVCGMQEVPQGQWHVLQELHGRLA